MAVLQVGTGGTGTTTATDTLTGVTAGSTIVAFAYDGSSQAPATMSVSDGTSYTARGTQQSTSDFVTGQIFTRENVGSGTHAVQVTGSSGNAMFVVAVELSAQSTSFSGSNSNPQASPGTTTDAVTSNSVTVTGSATLIACSVDTSVVDSTKSPAAGTGFTDQAHNSNSTIGSWRVSSKSVSSNAAATATAVTGTDNFLTMAAAILEAAGATGTVTPTMIFILP